MPPNRRHLTLGAFGLAVGTVGIVSYDHLDDAAAETDAGIDRLDELAERWERIGPAQAAAVALLTSQRLAGIDGPNTAVVRARALAMYAMAQADGGYAYQAAQIAAYAKQAAAEAFRRTNPRSPLRAMAVEARSTAETVEGELHSQAAPHGTMAVEILAAAGRRAGESATAARALALEGYARAVRGDNEADVLDPLTRAQDIISRPGVAGGFPHFTAGHLHAFGGAGLRFVAKSRAREWLTTADAELAATGLPGIRVANTLYWARLEADAGDWDAAYGYAAGAVDASRPRGIPAWLTGGVQGLARTARGRGGDWASLRAAVTPAV